MGSLLNYTLLLLLGLALNTVSSERMIPAECRQDVTFIIDTSLSIPKDAFPGVIKMLKDIVGGLVISQNATRVSLIIFSSQAHTIFHFVDYNDKERLMSAFNQMPYLGAMTNLAAGLTKWRLDHHPHTESVNRDSTVIILTDTNITEQYMYDYDRELYEWGDIRSHGQMGVVFIGVGSVDEVTVRRLAPDLELYLPTLEDADRRDAIVHAVLIDDVLKVCRDDSVLNTTSPPPTNSSCPTGHFGDDCMKRCYCRDKTEFCNVTSGDCTSGCQKGFGGVGCQVELPTMAGPIEITNITFTSVVVSFDRSPQGATGYRVWYRTWDDPAAAVSRWVTDDGSDRYEDMVPGLTPGATYIMWVLPYVMQDGENVYGRASPRAVFITKNLPTTTKITSTTVTTTMIPFIPGQVRVIQVHAESVVITFQASLTAVSGYRVIYREYWSSRQMLGAVIRHEQNKFQYEEEILDLNPDTNYALSVVPNIEGIDGRPSEEVNFKTLELTTSQPPPVIKTTLKAIMTGAVASKNATQPMDHVIIPRNVVIGISAGAGAGGLLFLLVIIALIIICYRRHQRKKAANRLPEVAGPAPVNQPVMGLHQHIRDLLDGQDGPFVVEATATVTARGVGGKGGGLPALEDGYERVGGATGGEDKMEMDLMPVGKQLY